MKGLDKSENERKTKRIEKRRKRVGRKRTRNQIDTDIEEEKEGRSENEHRNIRDYKVEVTRGEDEEKMMNKDVHCMKFNAGSIVLECYCKSLSSVIL